LGLEVRLEAAAVWGWGCCFFLLGWLFFWVDISGLVRRSPVSIEAYNWPSRTVTDGGGLRELGAAVLQPHAGGLANVLASDLHSILPLHAVIASGRLEICIGGVLGIPRLGGRVALNLDTVERLSRSCRLFARVVEPNAVERVLWLAAQLVWRRLSSPDRPMRRRGLGLLPYLVA
jgi:hypothetical protein